MKEDRTIITFDVESPEQDAKGAKGAKKAVPNVAPATSEAASSVAPAASEVAPDVAPATTKVASSVAPATNKAVSDVAPATAPHSNNQAPSYVTKKFLIVCLIIVMVVSTALGAGIAVLLCNNSSSGLFSNHDQGLAESDLSKATGSELTIAEINDLNEDAVVEIVTSGTTQGMFGQLQLTEGAGSGVIVQSNGYIVTNYHVIEGASKVEVTLHNGKSYKASIVGGDYDNDIAVLKISAKNLTAVTIGDSSKLDVGDLAVAIGNPLGQLGGTCTQGIISSLNRRLSIGDRTLDLLQTDSAINPGNSGGGLFNSKGELIGIVESKTSGTGIEGLGFAIPINTVKEEIFEIIKTGKISSKPAIGITIYDVSEEVASANNLDGAGVYVAEVTGDNAKKAGFQTGDKILKLDGKDFDQSNDFIKQVRTHKIGETITVTIKRNGKTLELKTVLDSIDITD